MDYNSSELTIGWFNDEYRKGTLKIQPPYQRKPVWAARQKCFLIETVLMRLPIPEIYIQQSTSAEGVTNYNIVDGQQRIRTVLQFIGSDMDVDQQDFNKFALDKLLPPSNWRNLTFAELVDLEKRKFYGYRFAVRYLNTDNETDVRDVFKRLNEFGAPLKPQELRNATYIGPFIHLATFLADNDYWAENRIANAASIRRMNDIEFVSELMIGVLHGPQGGSGKIIDEYYKQYEDYEDEFPEQRRVKEEFNSTLNTIQEFYPNIKDSRWSNKTDFYSLFVCLASLSRTKNLPKTAYSEIKKKLEDFADKVKIRLADEKADVSKRVTSYVRAVEKGANDKARRAERHRVLIEVLDELFEPKT